MNSRQPANRRFRRWTRCALVAVLLGHATTWAVSWGLAFRSITGAPTAGTSARAPDAMVVTRSGEEVAAGLVDIERHRGFGSVVYWSFLPRNSAPGPSDPSAEELIPWYMQRMVLRWPKRVPFGEGRRFIEARGWPFYALYTTRTGFNGLRSGGLTLSDKQMWTYNGFFEYVALPCRPIWIGLVGNTAVYAFVWAFLVFGVAAWRTKRRLGAGQCPTCRYDLRGTPAGMPCPECGGAVVSAREAGGR